MANETTTTDTTTTQHETKAQDKDQEQQKTVPLSEHIELRKQNKAFKDRLEEIEKADLDRKNADLPEIERLKKENERLGSEVGKFGQEKAKSKALQKAKGKIGEGYTLEGAEDNILEAIETLSFNEETVEADVRRIVELAKRPKTAGKSPILNTAAKEYGSGKKPSELSGKELQALQREDPEEFKRVCAERDKSKAWPSIPQPVNQQTGNAG